MKAWELLNSAETWTKGAYARDVYGDCVTIYSADAVRWCVIGAIAKCYNPESQLHMKAESLLSKVVGSPTTWNDASDYQTVYNTLKELDI